jgi:hypothetical protein
LCNTAHTKQTIRNHKKIDKRGIAVLELLALPGVETVAITGIEADMTQST